MKAGARKVKVKLCKGWAKANCSRALFFSTMFGGAYTTGTVYFFKEQLDYTGELQNRTWPRLLPLSQGGQPEPLVDKQVLWPPLLQLYKEVQYHVGKGGCQQFTASRYLQYTKPSYATAISWGALAGRHGNYLAWKHSQYAAYLKSSDTFVCKPQACYRVNVFHLAVTVLENKSL